MIREKTIRDIKNKIDSHPKFTVFDFIFEVKSETLKIIYEFNEDFFLKVTVPKNTINKTITETKSNHFRGTDSTIERDIEVYEFRVNRTPGEYVINQFYDYHGLSELLGGTYDWLNSIWDEMISIKKGREFSYDEETINAFKESLNKESNDPFNSEEIIEMKEQLNKLAKDLEARISESTIDKEELEKKLVELNNEIEILKEKTAILSKKNFYKSAYTAISSFLKRNSIQKCIDSSGSLLITELIKRDKE